MALHGSQDNAKWYVLNFIGSSFRDTPQKEIDRFNTACDSALELFNPTYVERIEKDGELRFRTVNLTFHYVFVRGEFEKVKQLCGNTNGFSFLIDRGSIDRYATITDDRMEHFRTIARAYQNCLPYYSLDDIELEDGDLVEVINGDFPGLKGRYMPRPKSKSGNIILGIYNNVGTIAFNVKATDVRVLEFSRHSTRANDQIDAFVPHLLAALRCYHLKAPLSPTLAAKLTVFCGRMGVVKLNNKKLDARLRILLYAANHIMGNSAEARAAYLKYQSIKDSVTNEWTIGLISLIIRVLDEDIESLKTSYKLLMSISAVSRAQQYLIAEYKHYLNNNIVPD